MSTVPPPPGTTLAERAAGPVAVVATTTTTTTNDEESDEEGEVAESPAERAQAQEHAAEEQHERDSVLLEKQKADFRWMKVSLALAQSVFSYNEGYFVNIDTGKSTQEDPNEPVWLAKANPIMVQSVVPNYEAGLQKPGVAAPKGPPKDYKGYNPKIHGSYDATADYAKYHEELRAQEAGMHESQSSHQPAYGATMILNARTGHAQANRPGAEHHNDFAKSGRQMNAFFDAEGAANAHAGKSLKEERKKQKLTKKEIAEFRHKEKERKRKKQMDWLKK